MSNEIINILVENVRINKVSSSYLNLLLLMCSEDDSALFETDLLNGYKDNRNTIFLIPESNS